MEDRVLLSTVPRGPPVAVPIPYPTTALVALLQDQMPVVSDELAALNAAGGLAGTGSGQTADFNALGVEFAALDGELFGLGQSLTQDVVADKGKTQVGDIQITKTVDKGSVKLAEIQKQIQGLAGGFEVGNLNPVFAPVESLGTDSTSLVNTLSQLALGQFAPGQVAGGQVAQGQLASGTDGQSQALELKAAIVSAEFLGLDWSILKIGSELALGQKVGPGDQILLQATLNQIVVSSSTLGDESLQEQVLGLANDIVGLLPLGGIPGGGIV